MNLSIQPPVRPGDAMPPEDEFDGRLRDFFRAEMPNPWPVFHAPVTRREMLPFRTPRRRFSLMRSRLALAASVALIVGGALLLSGSIRDGKVGPNTENMTAPQATKTKPIRLEESIEVNKDGPATIRVKAYDEPLP